MFQAELRPKDEVNAFRGFTNRWILYYNGLLHIEKQKELFKDNFI